MPQVHYMVGSALLANGRLNRAIESFTAALRLAPTWTDAWVNLDVTQYRRTDINAAKQAMQRALAAQPGHRGAAPNLGAFLWMTGDAEAGETLLRETLVGDPAAAEARVYLALCLLQDERAAEALAVLDEQPVPSEPRLASDWQMQRSLALLQVGRRRRRVPCSASLASPLPGRNYRCNGAPCWRRRTATRPAPTNTRLGWRRCSPPPRRCFLSISSQHILTSLDSGRSAASRIAPFRIGCRGIVSWRGWNRSPATRTVNLSAQ